MKNQPESRLRSIPEAGLPTTDPPNTSYPQCPVPPALLTLSLIRKHYLPLAERTLRRWISSSHFPRPDIAGWRKSQVFWKKKLPLKIGFRNKRKNHD